MLTGIILAGGPNQRMEGELKALLPFAGEPLIQRQIREMNKLCSEVIVVTQEPKPFLRLLDINVRIITDYFTGKGYLAGMHAGFSLASYQDIWVVSGDKPFLSAKAAELLWDRKKGGFDAVVPTVGEETYPLHGIYDRSCAEAAFVLLNRGENSLELFLKEIHWVEFSGKAMEERGIDLCFLFSIDTKEEYSKAILLSD